VSGGLMLTLKIRVLWSVRSGAHFSYVFGGFPVHDLAVVEGRADEHVGIGFGGDVVVGE